MNKSQQILFLLDESREEEEVLERRIYNLDGTFKDVSDAPAPTASANDEPAFAPPGVSHAKMRLDSFKAKVGMGAKLALHVNLRTDKTTSAEKLKAWIWVLKAEGLDELAQYAEAKLKRIS